MDEGTYVDRVVRVAHMMDVRTAFVSNAQVQEALQVRGACLSVTSAPDLSHARAASCPARHFSCFVITQPAVAVYRVRQRVAPYLAASAGPASLCSLHTPLRDTAPVTTCTEEELQRARKIKDAVIHPDTGALCAVPSV